MEETQGVYYVGGGGDTVESGPGRLLVNYREGENQNGGRRCTDYLIKKDFMFGVLVYKIKYFTSRRTCCEVIFMLFFILFYVWIKIMSRRIFGGNRGVTDTLVPKSYFWVVLMNGEVEVDGGGDGG